MRNRSLSLVVALAVAVVGLFVYRSWSEAQQAAAVREKLLEDVTLALAAPRGQEADVSRLVAGLLELGEEDHEALLALARLELARKRYEAARRPRIANVLKRGRLNRLAWHAAGPVATARNLVLRAKGPERLAADLDIAIEIISDDSVIGSHAPADDPDFNATRRRAVLTAHTPTGHKCLSKIVRFKSPNASS